MSGTIPPKIYHELISRNQFCFIFSLSLFFQLFFPCDNFDSSTDKVFPTFFSNALCWHHKSYLLRLSLVNWNVCVRLMDDDWVRASWKLCSRCILSWLHKEISTLINITKPEQAHNFCRAHWMLASSLHLLLLRLVPLTCLCASSPCRVAIITRETVQSCLTHCRHTPYDC